MIKSAIPTLLMMGDRAYNRHTRFTRARGAWYKLFRLYMRVIGGNAPKFRLPSGLQFTYSDRVVADVVMRDLLIKGVFEPNETEVLLRLLRPGGVFVDIGANIGYFSLLVGRLVGVTGAVIAFEPAASTYEVLCKNVELNALTNVTTVKQGCYSAVSQMMMAEMDDSGKSYVKNDNGGGNGVVSLTTLDEYFKNQQTGRIDCIKIDAEGCEMEILKGGRQTIERYRPAIIMETDNLSRFGSTLRDATSFMHSQQYEVCEMVGDHSLDLLCLPSEISIPGWRGPTSAMELAELSRQERKS